MKKIIYFLSAMCLLLLSCEKEYDQNRLWLSHTEIEFSYQAGTQEVIIVADGEWEFWYDAHWIWVGITIDNLGNKGLWVSVRTNHHPADRNAKIVISLSGTDTKEVITILQTGNNNAYHNAYATIIGRRAGWCGFLVQLDEDAVGLPFPFERNNGIYGVIDLPEKYKNVGERINVTFRPAAITCPLIYIVPEFLYIVRVNSMDGMIFGK